MDIRFLPHNIHLEDPGLFSSRDPHLQHLQKQSLIHRSELLDLLPRHNPGIYTISGGRQIGKTTLLKQWMDELLESSVAPECIIYYTLMHIIGAPFPRYSVSLHPFLYGMAIFVPYILFTSIQKRRSRREHFEQAK